MLCEVAGILEELAAQGRLTLIAGSGAVNFSLQGRRKLLTTVEDGHVTLRASKDDQPVTRAALPRHVGNVAQRDSPPSWKSRQALGAS